MLGDRSGVCWGLHRLRGLSEGEALPRGFAGAALGAEEAAPGGAEIVGFGAPLSKFWGLGVDIFLFGFDLGTKQVVFIGRPILVVVFLISHFWPPLKAT